MLADSLFAASALLHRSSPALHAALSHSAISCRSSSIFVSATCSIEVLMGYSFSACIRTQILP
jgi:hypothetical protein